jgi:hypothetical protein
VHGLALHGCNGHDEYICIYMYAHLYFLLFRMINAFH